jgi:hypothetical protein
VFGVEDGLEHPAESANLLMPRDFFPEFVVEAFDFAFGDQFVSSGHLFVVAISSDCGCASRRKCAEFISGTAARLRRKFSGGLGFGRRTAVSRGDRDFDLISPL